MSADIGSDKNVILSFLPWDDEAAWVSNDEMHIGGISPNSQASRLSELQAEGLAVSRYRNGKRFKEWARRRFPVAPKMKVEAPRFRVTAVETTILGTDRVIIEAPKDALRPGQLLRLV